MTREVEEVSVRVRGGLGGKHQEKKGEQAGRKEWFAQWGM
jgi:hypothetical protein